jgi:hypothetical protein
LILLLGTALNFPPWQLWRIGVALAVFAIFGLVTWADYHEWASGRDQRDVQILKEDCARLIKALHALARRQRRAQDEAFEAGRSLAGGDLISEWNEGYMTDGRDILRRLGAVGVSADDRYVSCLLRDIPPVNVIGVETMATELEEMCREL